MALQNKPEQSALWFAIKSDGYKYELFKLFLLDALEENFQEKMNSNKMICSIQFVILSLSDNHS